VNVAEKHVAALVWCNRHGDQRWVPIRTGSDWIRT